MRWTVAFAFAAALAGCSMKHDGHSAGESSHQHPAQDQPAGDAHAGHGSHGGQATMMVSTEPASPKAGEKTTLKLMLHGADGAMVKDFEIVHEQKVHLIFVRDGLDQFAHLHPEIDSAGNLTVAYTFPTGGTYRVYADFKPAGKPATTAQAKVKVSGATPPAPPLVANAPGRVAADGLRATITVEGAKAGGEARIGFALADAAGKAVTDLQPYMGAMGHLVVVSADGEEYVHAHAMDDKSAGGEVMLMAHFGKPGLYKGWGQFQRGGKVHVVPFVVKVE